MSGVLHTLPGWRRPIGALDYHLSDIADRESDSLADAVYDLLSSPMDDVTLLAGVRDEWGSCTEDQLSEVMRRLRRAGHVRRRRGGEYARARSA